jgi:hypothetical protein
MTHQASGATRLQRFSREVVVDERDKFASSDAIVVMNVKPTSAKIW